MAERRSLYFIVSFFLLHCLVKGFEGNKGHQFWSEKPCVSILATDSETFKGTILNLPNQFVSFFINLSDMGTSTLRFKNVEELLKVRDNPIFSSVLALSSCLIIIIETNYENGILDVIDMVGDFRAERKHLLVIVPKYNEEMLKNITINYEVTFEHRDEGNISTILCGIDFLNIRTTNVLTFTLLV